MLRFILGREPALVAGFVGALLSVAVAFGLDLTGEQTAAITAAVSALLAVVVRQSVVPVPKVTEAVTEVVEELTPATVGVAGETTKVAESVIGRVVGGLLGGK